VVTIGVMRGKSVAASRIVLACVQVELAGMIRVMVEKPALPVRLTVGGVSVIAVQSTLVLAVRVTARTPSV